MKAGDKITVDEAVLALVTKSANDVATVLAKALGGTEKNFATIMTRQARALGMTRTTFRNASGLPNRRQLTTARDLARLSLALIRDFPDRYRLFATRTFKFRGRNYRNHNNLLASYDGADGIKTGYIRASGYNLAASAERDGIRLIGVVMGGKSARKRDRHMARLLDKAFAAARAINVAAASNGAVVAKEKPMASGHGWSVQVGAFHRFGQAHLAVARAVRLAPRLLFKADIWISTVQGKKRTLYRARLTGLTKKRATEVCQALISRKMDCLAVAPPPGVNLALNPN